MVKLLGEGAKFSLIAQTMVFLVLFLLALLILAMKLIFYRPNRNAANPEDRVPQEPEEVIRVAAIAAALEMHRQAGIGESPPIVGQEGPWAPRQGRTVMSQSKSRRWSHD
jgi:Na+-transporting methylmalonyl-CoA/oxaloacetate decarboxylase gamma subunit